MEGQLVKFEQQTDAATVAALLQKVARDLLEGKLKVEANGDSVAFDLKGDLELEVEAEYNPAKRKYSFELSIDWREP